MLHPRTGSRDQYVSSDVVCWTWDEGHLTVNSLHDRSPNSSLVSEVSRVLHKTQFIALQWHLLSSLLSARVSLIYVVRMTITVLPVSAPLACLHHALWLFYVNLQLVQSKTALSNIQQSAEKQTEVKSMLCGTMYPNTAGVSRPYEGFHTCTGVAYTGYWETCNWFIRWPWIFRISYVTRPHLNVETRK